MYKKETALGQRVMAWPFDAVPQSLAPLHALEGVVSRFGGLDLELDVADLALRVDDDVRANRLEAAASEGPDEVAVWVGDERVGERLLLRGGKATRQRMVMSSRWYPDYAQSSTS